MLKIQKRQTKHLLLKKKPCTRRYSVNARSVSGGAGVGFIFADCFTIKGVRRLITISNVCLFRLKWFLNSSSLQFWLPFFHYPDSQKRFGPRLFLSFASLTISLPGRRIFNVSWLSSSLTDHHFFWIMIVSFINTISKLLSFSLKFCWKFAFKIDCRAEKVLSLYVIVFIQHDKKIDNCKDYYEVKVHTCIYIVIT